MNTFQREPFGLKSKVAAACLLPAVGCLFLAGVAAIPGWLAGAAHGQSPASNKPVDIQDLIRKLDSNDFTTREKTTNELMKCGKDALPHLQQLLRDTNPERRQRAAAVMNDYLQIQRRGRLEPLLAKGKDVPIDILIDTLTYNKEAVDDVAWRVVLNFARSIAAKVEKRTGVRPRNLVAQPFMAYAPTATDQIFQDNIFGSHRLLANQLRSRLGMCSSLVVCRGSFDSADGVLGACVFLGNGPINLGDGKIAADIGDSLVFCDGDVTCDRANRSIILATGRVKVERATHCLIRQNGVGLREFVNVFDPAQIGVGLQPSTHGLIVTGVSANTVFAKAGLRKGDVITSLKNAPQDNLQQFRKVLRRCLVESADVHIVVQRQEDQLNMNISFAD